MGHKEAGWRQTWIMGEALKAVSVLVGSVRREGTSKVQDTLRWGEGADESHGNRGERTVLPRARCCSGKTRGQPSTGWTEGKKPGGCGQRLCLRSREKCCVLPGRRGKTGNAPRYEAWPVNSQQQQPAVRVASKPSRLSPPGHPSPVHKATVPSRRGDCGPLLVRGRLVG